MKFKSILRKAHVPNEYAIAHLGITICISKEKEVIAVDTESFLG